MQTTSVAGAVAPPPEAFLALPVVGPAGPAKAFPLVANLPQKWVSVASGERVRVQGSPGFQVVYLSVDGEVLAVPLDVARQVGQAIAQHAAAAQLRTLGYLRRAS